MKPRIWSREESQERFADAITPLGWSLLRAPTKSSLKTLARILGTSEPDVSDVIARIHGHVYGRRDFLKGGRGLKWKWAALVRVGRVLVGAAALSLRHPSRWFDEFLLRALDSLIVRDADLFASDWESHFLSLQKRMAEPVTEGLPVLPTFAAFQKVTAVVERTSDDYFADDFYVYFVKTTLHGALKKLGMRRGFSATEVESSLRALSQGFERNFSVRLANSARRALSGQAWVEEFGHLTDNWDLFAPTFAERPNLFESLVQGSAQTNANLSPLAEARQREEIRWSQQFGGDPRVLKMLRLFQEFLLIDEDQRAYSSRQYPELKKLFRWVSTSPAWREANLGASDLYFLDLEEIREGLRQNSFAKFAAVIPDRRTEFARALRTEPAAELVEIAPGEFLSGTAPLAPTKGQGLSAGRIAGPALVVRSFDDFKRLTPEHILILKNPTPAYAPYYPGCAGLVSETGGALSHGAIVAREFGIPMISGIPHLFDTIQDGAWIEMDGTSGELRMTP